MFCAYLTSPLYALQQRRALQGRAMRTGGIGTMAIPWLDHGFYATTLQLIRSDI